MLSHGHLKYPSKLLGSASPKTTALKFRKVPPLLFIYLSIHITYTSLQDVTLSSSLGNQTDLAQFEVQSARHANYTRSYPAQFLGDTSTFTVYRFIPRIARDEKLRRGLQGSRRTTGILGEEEL